MRYLGLDLGTRSLGFAISDKTGKIATPLKVINFKHEDYDYAVLEVIKVVTEYNIEAIALGLPKNMNNSEGFASDRSINFKKKLEEKINIPINLVDERLSTKEAENILLNANLSRNKRKKVIDGLAASIILDTFIKREENRHV